MSETKHFQTPEALERACQIASAQNPTLYVYGVQVAFQGARITMPKRLPKTAYSDSVVFSHRDFKRFYWKNGKQKEFSQKQIIADQQVGWGR